MAITLDNLKQPPSLDMSVEPKEDAPAHLPSQEMPSTPTVPPPPLTPSRVVAVQEGNAQVSTSSSDLEKKPSLEAKPNLLPDTPPRLVTIGKRPSKADMNQVVIDHPLGERVSPIVDRFIKQLNGNLDVCDGSTAEQNCLKELETSFEQAYTVFKRGKAHETEQEFDEFIQKFLQQVIEYPQVKDYLGSRTVSISAHSNQYPSSKRFMNKSPQMCIRVGDFVQTASVKEKKVSFSRLKQINTQEDTPDKFDATFWISDPDDIPDQAKKMTLLFRLLKWLLSTKNGRITMLLLVGGAFASSLGGGIAGENASKP